MHKLVVEYTSEFFEATCTDKHLDSIWITEVQVRFENTIKLSDCQIKIYRGRWSIINVVNFWLIIQVIIESKRYVIYLMLLTWQSL